MVKCCEEVLWRSVMKKCSGSVVEVSEGVLVKCCREVCGEVL